VPPATRRLWRRGPGPGTGQVSGRRDPGRLRWHASCLPLPTCAP
jgi:hypothetical protein